MTLAEAKSYIIYGIKEGYFDAGLFCDEDGDIIMRDEKLIKFADEASARGDAYDVYEDGLRDDNEPF